jgi:hypothetical protein
MMPALRFLMIVLRVVLCVEAAVIGYGAMRGVVPISNFCWSLVAAGSVIVSMTK